MRGPTPSAPTFTEVPMVLAVATDPGGSARSRSSMRYVIAVPDTSPTATPVTSRPSTSPGRSFQTAKRTAAAIIVATAATITPLRPILAATSDTVRRAAMVLAAKMA